MKQKTFLIVGFIASLFLAAIVSFYASSNPDGLEKVASDIGFIETAKDHTNSDGLLADYGVKGVETNVWLTIEDENGKEHTGTLFVN